MTTTDWRRLERAEDHAGTQSEEPIVIQIVWVAPGGERRLGERIVVGGGSQGVEDTIGVNGSLDKSFGISVDNYSV